MINKIEKSIAATLAAAVVLSPTILVIYVVNYFINIISLL